MRHANRIPETLRAVERLRHSHPDWRLGQLLENVAIWADVPVWKIEEESVLEEIERHLSQAVKHDS